MHAPRMSVSTLRAPSLRWTTVSYTHLDVYKRQYLTSMSDFVAMNGIYAKYFSQPFPARTTIAVAALPLGACVEIDLVVTA